MFESFVQTKIRNENEIINAATEFSRESILKSGLSDFSKNYLIYDFPEKTVKSEFLPRIEKSNKLFLNYVIRPKWTLLAFLFGNFESRPPNEIINRLSLFPFYKFYVDAVSDFIKDNSQIFVTKHEITEIIDETNKVIYDKLTVDISGIKIKNFFLQIFNLKYEAGSNNNNNNYNLESTIPYSFLKIFLEDKSYPDLIKKFKVIGDLSEDSEISLKDIIKILTGKYNSAEKSVNKSVEAPVEEQIQEQIEESAEKFIETDSDEIIISDVKKDASGKTITGKLSVTKEILILDKDEKIVQKNIKQEKFIQENIAQENIKQEGMKPGEAAEEIYSEGLIKANKEAEAKSKEENNNLPEAEQKRNQILKDLFDKKHFQKILNKVYKLDLINSEKSFDKLSEYKTWKEASYHLKEIFRNNRVDIYNKDVMKFVNVLNDYFKQKE